MTSEFVLQPSLCDPGELVVAFARTLTMHCLAFLVFGPLLEWPECTCSLGTLAYHSSVLKTALFHWGWDGSASD